MAWDWFIDLLDMPIDFWTLFLTVPVLIALWGLVLIWLVPRYIDWLERRDARQKGMPVRPAVSTVPISYLGGCEFLRCPNSLYYME